MSEISKRLSRRDFLKVAGFVGGVAGFFTLFPFLIPLAPKNFRTIEGSSPPHDWLDELKNQLGPNYSLKHDNRMLVYKKPNANRESLVFLRSTDTVVTFNVGADMDTGQQLSQSPREAVRWADGKHLYPLFDELVAVDNQLNAYTFDERSTFWWNNLGPNRIAGYEMSPMGDKKFIYVYDKDKKGSPRTKSPWAIDTKTGGLMRLSGTSNGRGRKVAVR